MITISDVAADEILKQAEAKSRSPIIRIGVRGGGCTGFTMFIEWDDMVNEYAETHDKFFHNKGATVVVDKKSFVLLDGSTLDYVSSFMQKGFKINAPNVKGSCGCGESVEF